MKVENKNSTVDPFAVNGSWENYEELRLTRLRQQRQRMENMKQVIEKYSKIITELELKNKALLLENQQYKNQLMNFENNIYQHSENYICIEEIEQYKRQLQKQQMIKQGLEKTIQELRQDISILSTAGPSGSRLKPNYLIQYETLRELYENLKIEVYSLSKQNFQLKTVIHEQSGHYNRKQAFWEEVNRDNDFGKIKIYAQRRSKMNTSVITEGNDNSLNQPRDKQKIKQLKTQINKQYELLQKFKANQEQQLQLIELLKTQKSKVCLCHLHGVKTSQKIISEKVVIIPQSRKIIN